MGIHIKVQGDLREVTNAPLSSCLFLNLITQILSVVPGRSPTNIIAGLQRCARVNTVAGMGYPFGRYLFSKPFLDQPLTGSC